MRHTFWGHIPVLALRRLIYVTQSLKITVCRSVEEILPLRRLWKSLCAAGNYTVFQSFD